MILWPRRREPGPIEPRIRVNPRPLELQTAKEILADIFHVRPGEVEEMIHNRLKERSWRGGERKAAGLMRKGCGLRASA